MRGIFASIDFPYAQFTTRGISGDQLYPVVWKVVKHLECAGLQVHALTCDKASPNRKFFRLHQTNPGELTYKTINPYSADQRYIYFFSDVPHLIKTIRNAASNSFAHNNKRFLWVSSSTTFPLLHVLVCMSMFLPLPSAPLSLPLSLPPLSLCLTLPPSHSPSTYRSTRSTYLGVTSWLCTTSVERNLAYHSCQRSNESMCF